MTSILVPVSPADLLDRISILKIKLERIVEPDSRANVAYEHALLSEAAGRAIPAVAGLEALCAELLEINTALWDIEDGIRACDDRRDFGPDFVALAQAVYRTNDRRAVVKRRINNLLGSAIIEEKSYRVASGLTD